MVYWYRKARTYCYCYSQSISQSAWALVYVYLFDFPHIWVPIPPPQCPPPPAACPPQISRTENVILIVFTTCTCWHNWMATICRLLNVRSLLEKPSKNKCPSSKETWNCGTLHMVATTCWVIYIYAEYISESYKRINILHLWIHICI